MEPVWLLLLVIAVYGGFIFPLMGATLSWREWLRIKSISTADVLASHGFNGGAHPAYNLPSSMVLRSSWRTTTRLLLHLSECPDRSMVFYGRFCHFSAGRKTNLGRYLLIGALGLAFFFAVSMGDLP